MTDARAHRRPQRARRRPRARAQPAAARGSPTSSARTCAKEQLEIFVQAARNRGDTLDHVLIAGPPGLGKTTLAGIIATELAWACTPPPGRRMERKVDVAGLLTNLQEGDVLFVDEIHRLNAAVEEVLYPAMEDFEIDIMIGEGPAARSIRMQVQPFTLIGATTRTGLLTTPLRDRFGVWQRLEYYEVETSWPPSCARSAGILGVHIDDDSALEIAGRSRGTPRVANRLLRRVRDFAEVRHQGIIDHDICLAALELFQVDGEGLDKLDRDILLHHRREVRRRARRPRHAGRGAGRGGRHAAGRLRALPDHARLSEAHAARPRAHALRLPPLRPEPPARAGTLFGAERRRRAAAAAHRATRSPARPVAAPERRLSGQPRPACGRRELCCCTPAADPAAPSPSPLGAPRAWSRCAVLANPNIQPSAEHERRLRACALRRRGRLSAGRRRCERGGARAARRGRGAGAGGLRSGAAPGEPRSAAGAAWACAWTPPARPPRARPAALLHHAHGEPVSASRPHPRAPARPPPSGTASSSSTWTARALSRELRREPAPGAVPPAVLRLRRQQMGGLAAARAASA